MRSWKGGACGVVYKNLQQRSTGKRQREWHKTSASTRVLPRRGTHAPKKRAFDMHNLVQLDPESSPVCSYLGPRSCRAGPDGPLTLSERLNVVCSLSRDSELVRCEPSKDKEVTVCQALLPPGCILQHLLCLAFPRDFSKAFFVLKGCFVDAGGSVYHVEVPLLSPS